MHKFQQVTDDSGSALPANVAKAIEEKIKDFLEQLPDMVGEMLKDMIPSQIRRDLGEQAIEPAALSEKDLVELSERVAKLSGDEGPVTGPEIMAHVRAQEDFDRLKSTPGVGPIASSFEDYSAANREHYASQSHASQEFSERSSKGTDPKSIFAELKASGALSENADEKEFCDAYAEGGM